jgi:hypothetical protein
MYWISWKSYILTDTRAYVLSVDNELTAKFHMVAARTLTVYLQLEPIFMAVEKILATRFHVVATKTLTVYFYR